MWRSHCTFACVVLMCKLSVHVRKKESFVKLCLTIMLVMDFETFPICFSAIKLESSPALPVYTLTSHPVLSWACEGSAFTGLALH